jgi:hypothetical protein
MERFGSRRWLKVCTLFIVGALLMFLVGCGSKQNTPAFNIAGGWFIYDATNTIQGEQGPNLFQFFTSDTTLTGTTSQGIGLTGTTTDQGVSFSWFVSDGATYTYNGTVGANGATMQGTWSNTKNQSGTWIGLINSAPSVNIATSPTSPTSWVLTTGGPQGTIDVSFTQSGNSISITTPQGLQNPPGTSSFLNLAFFVIGRDGATYTYVGTVTQSANSLATAMSGTWTNTNGQTGAWSAAPTS